MVEFSPTWESIGAALAVQLKQVAGIMQVYDRYPDRAISPLDMVAVVIREPEFTPSSFTFGTVTVAYTGELNVVVMPLKTDQPELSVADSNRCRNIGLSIQVYLHQNRSLAVEGKLARVSLDKSSIVRFSPPDGGDYAGVSIPYTVTMQYASNS